MMFTNERYITREVADKVPIEMQLPMWDFVERIVEKDYLQIFEFTPKENGIVEVMHKQEIPEFTYTYKIKNVGIKNKMKLYMIDNGEYSTLMFSHEY